MATLGCVICDGSTSHGKQIRFSCGHRFHEACSEQWKNAFIRNRTDKTNFTCPLCRKLVNYESSSTMSGFFFDSKLEEESKSGAIRSYFDNLEDEFNKGDNGPLSDNDKELLKILYNFEHLQEIDLSNIVNDTQYFIIFENCPHTIYYCHLSINMDEITTIDPVIINRRREDTSQSTSINPYQASYSERVFDTSLIFKIYEPI